MVYGVWWMVYGVWCMSVWCIVYGAWCTVYYHTGPEVRAEVCVVIYCRPADVAHLLAARAGHFIAAVTLVELSEASRASSNQCNSHVGLHVLAQ
jgi:hypothetical protein